MFMRLSTLIIPLILVAALALPPSAQALDKKATITHLSFHISHPAKKYDAKLLPGGAVVTAHFDPADLSKTSVDASFQVEYFNSSNELRDSHMMEVLEGIIFPAITWKGVATGAASAPVTVGKHEITVKGPLTVHGHTEEFETKVTLDVAENGLVTVDAQFAISLEAFEIERPSLVFVKIADEVPIKVKMVFPVGPALLAPAEPPAAEQGAAEAGSDPAAAPANGESKPAAAAPEAASEHDHAADTDPDHSD